MRVETQPGQGAPATDERGAAAASSQAGTRMADPELTGQPATARRWRDLLRWLAPRSPLLLPVIVICVAFWPGNMNADTLSQIDQVAGTYPINDQHAPIFAWLWKLVWPLGVGPGWILVAQVAAFAIGAYLVARTVLSPLGASLVAAAIALSPPVFGPLALIGRDVWFLDFLLLSFGLLALGIRRGEAVLRPALIGAAACAFFALAARQNAAAAVVVVAIAGSAVVLGPRLAARGRMVRVLTVVGSGVAITVGLVGIQVGIQRGAIKAQGAHPEQYLYLYDLAAFSRAENSDVLPRSVSPRGDLARIKATSSTDSLIPLAFGPPKVPTAFPVSAAQVADMRDAWTDQVTAHPLTYLNFRWDAWLHQIGIEQKPIFIYHPFIDPNPRGFHTAFGGPNSVARDYEEAFADSQLNGGILHRVWLYLLAAAACAFLLLRRRGAIAIVGALALAAWTYQAGLFFGTMGTGFRFEFPAVTIAILAAAVAVASYWPSTVRRRLAQPSASSSASAPATANSGARATT